MMKRLSLTLMVILGLTLLAANIVMADDASQEVAIQEALADYSAEIDTMPLSVEEKATLLSRAETALRDLVNQGCDVDIAVGLVGMSLTADGGPESAVAEFNTGITAGLSPDEAAEQAEEALDVDDEDDEGDLDDQDDDDQVDQDEDDADNGQEDGDGQDGTEDGD